MTVQTRANLYLLDANVLIDASRDYYQMERVPEFWTWLAHVGSLGVVKVPQEVHDEIKSGTDVLSDWIVQDEIEAALLLDEDVDPSIVATVVSRGYASDLTDYEIEQLGNDPFILAHALSSERRCVVTTEVSKPSRQRANRHIPDVCRDMGVLSIHTVQMLSDLDFRTGWKRSTPA